MVESVSTAGIPAGLLSSSVGSRQSPAPPAVAPVVTPASPSFSTPSLEEHGDLVDFSVTENGNQECCDSEPDSSTTVDISEAGDTCGDHRNIDHLRSGCSL
ncbi:hypothetical protein V6N13_097521 [Hibiscus sabdariffa]